MHLSALVVHLLVHSSALVPLKNIEPVFRCLSVSVREINGTDYYKIPLSLHLLISSTLTDSPAQIIEAAQECPVQYDAVWGLRRINTRSNARQYYYEYYASRFLSLFDVFL